MEEVVIRLLQGMSSLDNSLAPDPSDYARETLRRDVAEMVSLRVRIWNNIELHESAFAPNSASDDTTQQSLSPEQAMERARNERQRITMAASGGPVRPLSATRK